MATMSKQHRRACYTAAKVGGEILVFVHPDRDAAEADYGKLRASAATKVRAGYVPLAYAKRADVVACIRAMLMDWNW